jgi:3'-5' exoribonuclease
MIEEKLAQLPDFPPRLRTVVQHLVVSHHGSLQFGSPKVPLFPEALLLHYLDDLDSKMECMRALVEQDRQVEGHWTGYNSALERVVLKKLKYLGGGAEPDADPANGPAAGVLLQPVAAQPEREGEGAVASPPDSARLPGQPASRPPQPGTPGLFGEKLGQALREEE